MRKIALIMVCCLMFSSFSMYGFQVDGYGASSNSVNKVPTVLNDFVFDESTAPILRIEESHEGLLYATTQTFTLQLENADWTSEAEEDLVDFIEANNNLNEIDNGTDFVVDATLLNSSKMRISFFVDGNCSTEFYFEVPMLAEITDEGAVKVEIDSVDSALSSGMYTFAVASDCKTITTIDDTVEFTNNSVLEDVLIEELVIGSLSNNTQINLMLTDSNFKWEYNEGTTVTGSGGFDFSYTLQESDYNENTISFVIEDLDEFFFKCTRVKRKHYHKRVRN